MTLHFQCRPTALDPEQVKDYLFELQHRSKTPSQTYFKHTVYGLRFLLKGEGLPNEHLHLPSIARAEKLPVILSRQGGIKDKALIESLFAKEWIVYAKRPFGGPKQVMEYLGRYTHKVAISNHRIQSVDEATVTFSYKDYKAAGSNKQMTLSNEEFTRRFALHILPHRFVRIRHYGILSSSWKRGRLQALQQVLLVKRKEQPVKTLLRRCPCCKTGTLITIEVFGKRGPPKQYLLEKQAAPVA